MWLDEFPAAKELNADPLTPAQRLALEERAARQNQGQPPAFGAVPLTGTPTRFPSTQRADMRPTFVPAIVAAQNQYLNKLSNDMGDDVEEDIRRENESRVAQNREMRRMAHEQELERMRQQTEQQKVAALIARLDSQSGRVTRFPGGTIIHG